jgi:ATP-dependent protease HslVU (ClpYQ) peptidase subunit
MRDTVHIGRCAEDHVMVQFAGDTCPMCQMVDEFDIALGKLSDEVDEMKARLAAEPHKDKKRER